MNRQYEYRQDQARTRTDARQVPPPSEGRLPAQAVPVSLVPNALTPSRVPRQPQRDTALIVSRHQSEWRQEHHAHRTEHRITRAPVERPQEIAAQAPRREETPAQKPEQTRSIRYRR